MGSPPLRERMSGAVSRLISSCADIGGTLERRPAEYRVTNHKRMEDKAEDQIKRGSDSKSNDVVAVPTGRNRRRTGIGTVLESHPVIAGPGEKRPEQEDRTEIPVGDEMRRSPSLHAHQHGMLERAPDIATDVGCDNEDARQPHQDLGDVLGPMRRTPDMWPPGFPA